MSLVNKKIKNSSITEKEKKYLIPKLLNFLEEDKNSISSQLYISIAKISRISYPNEWKGLFSDIINIISTSSYQNIKKGVNLLYEIIKELSTKVEKDTIRSIGPDILKFIYSIWKKTQERIGEIIKNEKSLEELQYFTKLSEVTSKTIKILILYGVQGIEKNENSQNYLKYNLNYLSEFIKLSKSILIKKRRREFEYKTIRPINDIDVEDSREYSKSLSITVQGLFD
jgi:hypothetical protein